MSNKTIEEKYEEVKEQNQRLIRKIDLERMEGDLYKLAVANLGNGTYWPFHQVTDKSTLLIFFTVIGICITFITALLIFTFCTLGILING